MKKLFFILYLLTTFAANAQPVIQRSPATVTVEDMRHMAGLNEFIPRYFDTTAANQNLGVDSAGAIIYTYNTNTVWLRGNNPKAWISIGTGGNNTNDTIYVREPLGIDSTTYPGHRIMYLIHQDGLVSGGIVTWITGLTFSVSPADYFINGKEYNSPLTSITLAAADPTNPRTDQFYVDTTSSAGVITGTPASNPVIPQINPRYQIGLTSVGITVAANATTPSNITSTTIYDEGTEWDTAYTGSTTIRFNSTANPYHLTHSTYVQGYNYSTITYTQHTGADTTAAGEVLSMWVYSNGALLNTMSVSFYNGSALVANPITIQSGNYGFNSSLANTWQNVVIPLSAFNWQNSGIFNSLHVTLAGADISLTRGLYIDWIRIQSGVSNVNVQSTSKFPEINVDDYGGLNNALSSVGSNTKGILIATAQTLTKNTIIPSNVSLRIIQGGSINNNGNTLTVNSPMTAGRYQIFTGSGLITFGSGSVPFQYPEWDGGKNDGSDTSGTTHAFSLEIPRGITISLSANGIYSVDSIPSPSSQSITTGIVGEQGGFYVLPTIQLSHTARVGIQIGVGASNNKTVFANFRLLGNTTNIGGIQIGDAAYTTGFYQLNNLQVDGFEGTGAYGINIYRSQEGDILNCDIRNNYDDYLIPSGCVITTTDIHGRKGYAGQATHRGINIQGFVYNLNIYETTIESNAYEGVYSASGVSALYLNQIHFEGNALSGGFGQIYIKGGGGNMAYAFIDHNYFEPTTTVPCIYLDSIYDGVISQNKGLYYDTSIVIKGGASIQVANNPYAHYKNISGIVKDGTLFGLTIAPALAAGVSRSFTINALNSTQTRTRITLGSNTDSTHGSYVDATTYYNITNATGLILGVTDATTGLLTDAQVFDSSRRIFFNSPKLAYLLRPKLGTSDSLSIYTKIQVDSGLATKQNIFAALYQNGGVTNLIGTQPIGYGYNLMDGTFAIGDSTKNLGASLMVRTPSLSYDYPSGLGIDGTFSSLTSSLNIKALGVFSASGYTSTMNFWVTHNANLINTISLDTNKLYYNTTPKLTGFSHGIYEKSQVDSADALRISGSLTSGYIPKATAATVLANSLIYDNGSAVAIGRTSPDALFDMYGGGSVNSASDLSHYRSVAHYSSQGAPTGTMQITMPLTWNTNTWNFTIHGYNYSAPGGWEIFISAISSSSVKIWSNYNATVLGKTPFTSIRLGYDSTAAKMIILLGTTSTTWTYPFIEVSDVITSGFGAQTGWGSGWTIAPITNEAKFGSLSTIIPTYFVASSGNLLVNSVTDNGTGAVVQINGHLSIDSLANGSGTDSTVTTAGNVIKKIASAYGTYLPTLTNTTNVSSSSADTCTYTQQGNIVTVGFDLNWTPTSATTQTVLTFTLPIAVKASGSPFAYWANGTAYCENGSLAYGGVIAATVNGTTVTLTAYPTLTTAVDMKGTFQYRIN